MGCRVDGHGINAVDAPGDVVGEQEGVRADAEDAAGTAEHVGLWALSFQKSGEEVVWGAVGCGEADDLVAGADAWVAGAVQRDEEAAAEQGILRGELLDAERGAVRSEGGEGGRHLVAMGVGQRAEVRVGVDGAGAVVAVGPSVVERRVGGEGVLNLLRGDGEEGILGGAVAELVGAHIAGVERVINCRPMQANGIAQVLRDDVLVGAVGVHDGEGGADGLLLLAGIAGGADGNEELVFDAAICIAELAEGDRAGEVPATVFVTEAVAGVAGEYLGCAGGCGVTGVIAIADEAVGEREVEPGLSFGAGVEGEVIGVAQVLEVGDSAREGVACGIPAVEDVNGTAGIVGAVVHVGDEEAAVGRLGEEADAMQAAERDGDVEVAGEREGDGFAVGAGEFMGNKGGLSVGRDRRDAGEQEPEHATWHGVSVA